MKVLVEVASSTCNNAKAYKRGIRSTFEEVVEAILSCIKLWKRKNNSDKNKELAKTLWVLPLMIIVSMLAGNIYGNNTVSKQISHKINVGKQRIWQLI